MTLYDKTINRLKESTIAKVVGFDVVDDTVKPEDVSFLQASGEFEYDDYLVGYFLSQYAKRAVNSINPVIIFQKISKNKMLVYKSF